MHARTAHAPHGGLVCGCRRETNGAQQPVHNQPLAVKPTPWQDPWARDPREVRATEDQLAQAAAAIAKS